MALIKCKECGKEFSKNAKACPSCGSTKNRGFIRKHPIWTIVLVFIGIGFLGNVLIPNRVSKNNQNTNASILVKKDSDIVVDTPEVVKQEAKIIKQENWNYSSSEDKMRGTLTKYAVTESTNSLDLGFPYNDSKMGIIIRDTDGKKEVVLKVKGQFICNNYSEVCKVNVKFDNFPIEKLSFNKADNGVSDAIFLTSPNDFIKKLIVSKRLIIEPDLYDQGITQYEFYIDGLELK